MKNLLRLAVFSMFAIGAAVLPATPANAAVACGPVDFSQSGLTAYVTCSELDGFPNYQVIVSCPNHGPRYGPVRPVGQRNYAACLSASAGEGPPNAVAVRGVS